MEGVDAERIQTALLQGLSPDAKFQPQVDGLYNYSSVSPEQFASDLNSDYSATFDALVVERQRLEGAKEMANDADMKMKIQGQIDARLLKLNIFKLSMMIYLQVSLVEM